MKNLLHRLPLLKAEFTQIHAPKFPHLVDQLEFLADVVEDFAEDAYQDIPYTAAAASAFAIIYTHRLLDIIPDFVAQISFEDDSAVRERFREVRTRPAPKLEKDYPEALIGPGA
jgi:uncharacterized membrane protein YkvA (DUF1232 family)